MDKVTILKLGGSAITDKTGKCTPNIPVIEHVADQLSEFKAPIVLIHGGGSFAHPFVKESQLGSGLQDRSQLPAVSETEFYLGQLTRIIHAALLLRKVFCVPMHPMSLATLRKGKVKQFFFDPIRRSLSSGLVPLLHGDLVLDESRGIGILSGDKIASLIGLELNASRVLFGCDVDGVRSADPKSQGETSVISEVTFRNAREALAASQGPSVDVSGGMGAKVREAISLARKGCEANIFDLRERNALRKILTGTNGVGTKFVPWNKPRTSVKRRSQKA